MRLSRSGKGTVHALRDDTLQSGLQEGSFVKLRLLSPHTLGGGVRNTWVVFSALVKCFRSVPREEALHPRGIFEKGSIEHLHRKQ